MSRNPGRRGVSVFRPLHEAYDRHNLLDMIPLKHPISMLVDPASICNFRCKFCPTGDSRLVQDSGRSRSLMSLEIFDKVIKDISQFQGRLEALRLYKDGEPLLNPHFVEFVRMAKRCGKIGRVETTTNGSLLTREYNRRLIDAGIDRIVISVEGVSAERYRLFSGFRLNFGEFVATLTDLYENRSGCKIHIKTVRQNLRDGEVRRFKEIFGPISDRMFIENAVPSWPDFNLRGETKKARVAKNAFGQTLCQKAVCPYLFYFLAVNCDGTVSPCCVDWQHGLKLGSVRETSILDIWEDKPLKELRLQHLMFKRQQLKLCGTCGQIDYCTSENLDAAVATIRKRLGYG